MEIDRRTLMAGAVVVGAHVALGSGCTPEERKRPEKLQGPGTIAKAEIPVGGGIVLPDTNFVVTQPTAGEFRAFVKMCPHAGCAVSRVDDDGILCPCHGSRFDAATGRVKNGPASSNLSPATVTDDGDTLTISG